MRPLLASNAFVLFVGEASRGLTLSSLAAYAVTLSPAGAGAAVLSAGVSLFSVGRLAASFCLGELASRGVSYRTIVTACLLVQVLGNLLYALAAAAPASPGGVALFLLARLVLGFGSGTLGTCRAIVGEVTTANVRTREFAWLGFAKYVGYALTPILSIGLVGEWRVGGLTVNTFTAPAWLGVLLCLAALVPVRLYFGSALAPAEIEVIAPPQQLELPGVLAGASDSAAVAITVPLIAATQQAVPSILSSVPLAPQLRRLLLHSAVLFLWLNFLTKGVLALAEASLASTFALTFGTAGDEDLLQDTAEFITALGLAGLVAYLGMATKPTTKDAPAASEAAAEAASAPRPLRQRGSLVALAFDAWQWQRALIAAAAERASEVDVVLLLAGLAVSAFGAIIVASGSGSIAAAAAASSGSSLASLSIGMGLLWSLGAPVVDILTVSIFSQMLSGLSVGSAQARLMGFVSAAGALGRILLPLFIAVPGLGLHGAWAVAATLTALSLLLVCYFYALLPTVQSIPAGKDGFVSPFSQGGLLSCRARQPVPLASLSNL